MANWAIVIGVDKYWQPEASLRGAVRDALGIREWLIETAGVPDSNLFLLLAPVASDPVPKGIKYQRPTYKNITNAITALIEKSGARGERLYFHFSGHGLSNRNDYQDQDALLCSDFTTAITTMSIGLQSIVAQFAATELSEQFFFFDACRNVPWIEEFRIGYLPRPRKRDHSTPPVQQFIMYATSPGLVAVEDPADTGNEQGAFTTSLLSGLRGSGKAKAWDPREEDYVVRFDRLFEFVFEDMHAKKLQIGGSLGHERFQLPQSGGERGAISGSNPVLARFADTAVASEMLRVHIAPFDAAANPLVVVQREGAHVAMEKDIAEIPVEFTLRPRDYCVRGAADGLFPKERKGWWVELWGPRAVNMEFVAGADEPTGEPLTRGSRSVGGLKRGKKRGKRWLSRQGGKGTIELYSHDALALLELYDSAGILIGQSSGKLRRSIPPGIYRGVLRVPGAPAAFSMINVGEDEELTVTIDAPSPSLAVQQLIESDQYSVEKDKSVLVSESSGVGAIAGVQLATILAMAAGATLTSPDRLEAYNLRKLGIHGLDAVAPQGVLLLFGDETADVTVVRGSRIRYGLSSDFSSDSCPLDMIRPNIGQYAERSEPGFHWLSVELPNQRAVAIPVSILPGHICVIVLCRERDGGTTMFEYMPQAAAGDTAHPRFLRRVDLIQRLYMEGALDRAAQLLELDLVEPVTACLAGYAYLRLGRAAELDRIARNMTTQFSELSDSWIIQAEHALASGDEEQAKVAYVSALDRGIPILIEGISHLRDAAKEFSIDHPRVPLLDRIWEARVRRQLWTMFAREAISA